MRTFAAVGLALVCTSPAGAQVGTWLQYSPRPTVSPYLNMLRGGNAAVNYYGIIRPQMQTNLALQRLQFEQNFLLGQAVQSTQPPLDLGADQGPPSTGHPVQFMNTSRYFPLTQSRTGTPLAPSARSNYRR